MMEIISLATGYLVGSIPVGLWYGRATKGIDIREWGSGNVGATNVARTLGVKAALVVFLLDVSKGAAGPLVATCIGAATWSAPLAGLFAVAGHCWSPLLKFSGGRGIATSLGVLLVLDWRVGLTCFPIWLATVAITRYVSLGSILACVAVPPALLLFEYALALPPSAGDRGPNLAAGVVVALVAVVRHAANIRRLLQGTESKIGEKGGKREEAATEPEQAESGEDSTKPPG